MIGKGYHHSYQIQTEEFCLKQQVFDKIWEKYNVNSHRVEETQLMKVV